MKRLSKVKMKWSPDFSYAIGLIATDGNLSNDKRHINMTSKDEEMILNFKKCLNLKNKIGRKARGGSKIKKYFVIQFGDKNFYDFLLSIGLTPAKSKTLGSLKIPAEYFPDFLRGCIDGDGNIDIHKHPESQHPQLRIRIYSASPRFLEWIRKEVSKNLGIQKGWIEIKNDGHSAHILSYGKTDSIKIFELMYYEKSVTYLKRKYLKAKQFMRI